jgi:epsilon-lactone hydrolase
MTEQERRVVMDLLRSGPDMAQMSLAEVRAIVDQGGAVAKLPENVELESITIGGLPAEWSSTPEADDAAVLLYLHGGGYLFGSIASHRGMVTNLGALAGVRTLAVEYRLAPEHKFPSPLEDALASYQYLLGQGTDPAHIAVGGDSAGGGLTIALLLAVRDAGLPLPGAALCISPWVDLTLEGASIQTKEKMDAIVSRALLSHAVEEYLADTDDPLDPRASPLFGDLSGLPPVMIQVGSHEVVLDDATRLATRLAAADVGVRLDVWASMPHVWHRYAEMLGEGRLALEQAADFLRGRIR